MKILLIASGGDGSGMNKVVAELYKKFKNDIYACFAGFKGLYKNDIRPLKDFEPLKYENEAGCCIKTARFPEFKEDKFFRVALKHAREFDYVIVMGGNGSEKGCQDLTMGGVKTIFIPGTIDNDVDNSEYSIGFDTAIDQCCQTVKNVMPSMEAMERSCVFEAMGRHCPDIAEECAKRINAEVCIKEKSDLKYKEIASLIKSRKKEHLSTTIILRENILPIKEFADKLNEMLKDDAVKTQVVGYTQRGGKPTKVELENSKQFALVASQVIKKNLSSKKVLMQNGKIVMVDSTAKRNTTLKKFK